MACASRGLFGFHSDSLEHDFQTEAEGPLDEAIAPGIGDAGDFEYATGKGAVGGSKAGDVVRRIGELRGVRSVQCFGPELDVDAFGDVEAAEEAEIEIGDSGAANVVDTAGAEADACGAGDGAERGPVILSLAAAVAAEFLGRTEDIGGLLAARQVERCAVRGDGKG